MPRLLLVDDNPSIHRIAESLLAPTDVELTCVDSAAEALDRLGRGDTFDVALVDTAMPGMDGWTLLSRLRAMDATARMPIALMAGVLDPVDPAKLAKAPIQGFLKKPIELRELGDRVKALLATSVAPSPSPFSTVPATPAQDLVKKAEEALPELRPAEAPESILSMDLDLTAPEDDLLVLTAEDLWPEESTLRTVPEPPFNPLPDVHLELEELDLDSLQDLAEEAPVAPAPAPVPALDLEALLPEAGDEDDELVTLSGLDDLGDVHVAPPAFQPPPQSIPEPPPEPSAPSHALEAAAMVGSAAVVGLTAQSFLAKEHEPAPVEETLPHSSPAAGGQALAVSGQSEAGATAHAAPASAPVPAPSESNAVSSEQGRALVQALLADPVLVDALVKAVVARMGDQVLREIAWELMPDVAGRLQR
ncbi:response regulator [Geothrix sp. PMB-07]|uniref:response regulator n=1 Tax=Geothrix sp. PMB-07 TaxID=3068640 RepID=UPI002742138D|nr:response regulator [Geothrix sp. PMB-07]WLT31961.1 response regulator [Geothrix sp. PMB-07]